MIDIYLLKQKVQERIAKLSPLASTALDLAIGVCLTLAVVAIITLAGVL